MGSIVRMHELRVNSACLPILRIYDAALFKRLPCLLHACDAKVR